MKHLYEHMVIIKSKQHVLNPWKRRYSDKSLKCNMEEDIFFIYTKCLYLLQIAIIGIFWKNLFNCKLSLCFILLYNHIVVFTEKRVYYNIHRFT